MQRLRKRRFHGQGPVMTACLELLDETPCSALEIFNFTGITPDWLHRFKTGKVKEPGAPKVEHLYLFLCCTMGKDPKDAYVKTAEEYRSALNKGRLAAEAARNA